MKKRKLMALALSCVMVCSMTACGGKDTGSDQSASTSTPAPAPAEKEEAPAEKASTTENTDSQTPTGSTQAADITLWTYPIGSWGDSATVDGKL